MVIGDFLFAADDSRSRTFKAHFDIVSVGGLE